MPTKRSPRSAHSAVRRFVSLKWELPASMTMSPSSSSGASSSITASTGPPALTMMMILRGRASAATNSSTDPVPVIAPSWPNSSTNSVVLDAVRLCTAIE